MNIIELKKENPKLYQTIFDIAIYRIQRRIGDLQLLDRFEQIFKEPFLINGRSFTKRFVETLKLNFSKEEINNTILTNNIPQKFNDFIFIHSKGKISSFSDFVNIAGDHYLKTEMQKIFNYTEYYSKKIPNETIMNNIVLDYNNPLKIK